MDRVFSSRIDESILQKLENATRQLKMTKKQFLEEAIELKLKQVEPDGLEDIWAASSGAWARSESAEALVEQAKSPFREAFSKKKK